MIKDKISEKPTKIERNFNTASYLLPLIALVIGLMIAIVYFVKFNTSMFEQFSLGSNNEFGTFGDFIGGTLNPLLSFFTIVLLIYSIRFQIEELRATRREMEQSTDAVVASNELNAQMVNNQIKAFNTERLCSQAESLRIALIKEYDTKIVTQYFSQATYSQSNLDPVEGSHPFYSIMFNRDALLQVLLDFRARKDILEIMNNMKILNHALLQVIYFADHNEVEKSFICQVLVRLTDRVAKVPEDYDCYLLEEEDFDDENTRRLVNDFYLDTRMTYSKATDFIRNNLQKLRPD